MGQDRPALLDASRSSDPDDAKSSVMSFSWFCRREDEVFPDNYDIIETGDKSAGCFRDGRFMLTSDMAGFEPRDPEQKIVQVYCSSYSFVFR